MRMSGLPRLRRTEGRHALVDGIPFTLPVDSKDTAALMAAFPISLAKAQAALPGNEVHALSFGGKGVLLVTVVDYRKTDIGKYIEFSLAIACTHGRRAAPPYLPLLMPRAFGVGQFVVDLPVSTEISVKGGKGIWGMPKHQANLNFIVSDTSVSSQYDLDEKLCVKVEVKKPSFTGIPLRVSAANLCEFRGLLMKSYIHFQGSAGMNLFDRGSAQLSLGDHPRAERLKRLEVEPKALFSAYIPKARGMLDDYFESWFVSHESPPEQATEGLESVIDLGLSQEWLDPPQSTPPLAPAESTPTVAA